MDQGHSVNQVLAFGAIAALAALAGCASSGYSTSYRPAEGVSAEVIASQRAASPGEPLLERTAAAAEPQQLFAAYEKRGYVLIGSSSFNSDQRASEADALAQGRKVGADLVVIVNPRQTGSTTNTVARHAPASSRNSPVTMFGDAVPPAADSRQRTQGTQTAAMTVQHMDFGAGYFVKRR
jgi:hypothetical protein